MKSTKPKGASAGRHRPLPVKENQKPVYVHVPKTKKDKERLKIPKDQRGISVEQAYARASSLAPIRLTLTINQNLFINFLRTLAIMISYEIQSKGRMPLFQSDPNFGWNPSTILAYLIIVTTGYLARVGALPASSQFMVAKQYKVPTFVGKWMQQCLGRTKDHDRNVVVFLDIPTDVLLSEICGTGGVGNIPGMAPAPCYIPTANDNEGWYSLEGTSQTTITPASLSNELLNKISSIMDKVFEHTVAVGDIPDDSSSTELKQTPVAEGFTGDFMYSCISSKTMCDILLPLSSIFNPELVNSNGPLQVAAPVRIDGGLCAAPQAKLAFIFWLANRMEFRAKDSFYTYLRKFGFQDKHMGNLQVNLRQLNWNGLLHICMTYLQTFTDLDSQDYWYLVTFTATVLLSNIPGCIRAVSPQSLGWSLAPLYKTRNNNSVYSAFAQNPKMAPYMTLIVEALRAPIRFENQVTFFINVLPEENTPCWWSQVATSGSVTLGSDQNYGNIPSNPSVTGLAITNGPYRPYPAASTAGSIPSGFPPDCERNYIPINGLNLLNGLLSNSLSNKNGDTNLYNQWVSKAAQFTRRWGKYLLLTTLSDSPNGFPATGANFFIRFPVPQLLSSWEPGSYKTSCLAVCFPFLYYSATQNIPGPQLIGPTFGADPVSTAADALGPAMSASTPGQGTSQAVMVGKSNNPQEVQAHLAGDSAAGVVADSSEKPPKHLKKQVEEKLTNSVKTLASDTADLAGDFLGNVLNKI